MIDRRPFSFHTTVACTVLLLILSYFVDSVLNVPTMQYLTQEVYGSLGIGGNITKEMSTQVPGILNITAGGGSDNQTQQSIGNMTQVPFNEINSTNLIAISPALQPKQVGNDTTANRTVIVIPPQPVQSKPTLNEPSIIGPPRITQPNPLGAIESGDMRVNTSALKPITKEQAAKADQEANIMIKAYYEKLEQEKQIENEREQAAALAASAQANQTMGSAGQIEGSQDGIAATLTDGIDADVEDDTEEEVEGEDEENDDNGDEDNEQNDDDE